MSRWLLQSLDNLLVCFCSAAIHASLCLIQLLWSICGFYYTLVNHDYMTSSYNLFCLIYFVDFILVLAVTICHLVTTPYYRRFPDIIVLGSITVLLTVVSVVFLVFLAIAYDPRRDHLMFAVLDSGDPNNDIDHQDVKHTFLLFFSVSLFGQVCGLTYLFFLYRHGSVIMDGHFHHTHGNMIIEEEEED